MGYNLDKMFWKRSLSISLILSLTLTNLLPIFAYKAEAQWVVIDPALVGLTTAENTRKTVKDVLDSVAMFAARLAIQQVVNSTVNWAQSGFDGNPAYVVDPEQYFLDLGDGIAGQYIEGNSDLNFLCSPFQTQVRLALRHQYLNELQYQCTLTDVVQNLDAFYSDFSQGGWDAWFVMTQTAGGNPYGAYLEAQADLDSRIANAVGLKRQQLDWDNGFLSKKVCDSPVTQANIDANNALVDSGSLLPQNNALAGKKTGDCIGTERTVTPGSIIKSQLDRVLPSGLESLITVNHVEQLIQAFATGLLNRYVFGSEGLFKKGSPLPTDTPGSSGGSGGQTGAFGVDIDGDGKNDIIDTDGDSAPDSCIYGGTYPNCTNLSITAAENSGVVWGYVFSDTNRNGSRDTGEQDLSGISVHLKNTSGDEIGNSSTFNGIYSFNELRVGSDYTVSIDVPEGQMVTSGNDATARAVVLIPNQPIKNFGLAPTQ